MDIQTLQTFLGWNLVIHVGLLFFIVALLTLGQNWIVKMHQTMFEISKEQLLRVYFN